MNDADFTRRVMGMQPALYSLTRRFTRNHDDSLDLIQDTLIKALVFRDHFRENTNLQGWLFTIMRNTFINNYRRKQRADMRVELMTNPHVMNCEEQHSFNRPQESLQIKEIWHGVNHMKDDLLIPFKMHFSGYKYHEIAERLNVPIGTVKNRIFHARKEMQRKLQGYR